MEESSLVNVPYNIKFFCKLKINENHRLSLLSVSGFCPETVLTASGLSCRVGGSNADAGKQTEAGRRSQRVPGASHSRRLHAEGVCERQASR